jgi:elongation factor G
VVNVKVILYDGSFHPVDSSDIAFKIAASMAFKKAMELAQPVLLEPTMLVEVLTPKDTTGDVTSDLNSRRGKILGIDAREDAQFVRAHVPLAEMYKYASTLRSITQNRGSYVMKFSHYQEVPAFLTEKIIEEAKSKKGKGE